jgi:hypothetical protein
MAPVMMRQQMNDGALAVSSSLSFQMRKGTIAVLPTVTVLGRFVLYQEWFMIADKVKLDATHARTTQCLDPTLPSCASTRAKAV